MSLSCQRCGGGPVVTHDPYDELLPGFDPDDVLQLCEECASRRCDRCEEPIGLSECAEVVGPNGNHQLVHASCVLADEEVA